jgi:hypothetical protein
MRTWIWLPLAMAMLAGGSALVVRAAVEPQEMIHDGGFENGDIGGIGTSWASESWGANTVRFELATDKVQAGKYCQHMHVEGYKDGGTQIRQLGMHLTKGKGYTITLWMRGNLSVPVTVGFRKHGPPYTFYLRQDLRVSPAWQRFTITGPAADSDEDAGLYLGFAGDGDLWIDSISAKAAPAVSSAAASLAPATG